MTVKELKEILKDVNDDVVVLVDSNAVDDEIYLEVIRAYTDEDMVTKEVLFVIEAD